jgi:hypothetical protein
MPLSSSRAGETWQWRHYGGLPFYASTGSQRSSRTNWGRGRWSDLAVATQGSIMVGPWDLGDVIVATKKKRWQGDATASYHCDTKKDGVQRSKDLTMIARGNSDPTSSTYPVDWFDAKRALRLGGKKPSWQRWLSKRFLWRKGRLVNKYLPKFVY